MSYTGGRSCLSTELYTLESRELINQEREIMHYFSKQLTHIDYMLYKIEAGSFEESIREYKTKYTIPQLREKLTTQLLVFAMAKDYRDTNIKLRRVSTIKYQKKYNKRDRARRK
jgi:hypothetical protein